MLRFLVPAQVDFALKGPAAQVARERFVSGVLPAVRDQIGRLAERFTAHLTFVRFFACKTPIETRYIFTDTISRGMVAL